jgi:PST family polysaccharide transporter
MFRYALVSLGLLLACVLIGVQWGLLGAAFGYSVAVMIGTGLLIRAVLRVAGIPVAAWMAAMRGPVLATASMAVVLFVAQQGGLQGSPSRDLPLLIGLGVLWYAAAILVLDRPLCQRIWELRTGQAGGRT